MTRAAQTKRRQRRRPTVRTSRDEHVQSTLRGKKTMQSGTRPRGRAIRNGNRRTFTGSVGRHDGNVPFRHLLFLKKNKIHVSMRMCTGPPYLVLFPRALGRVKRKKYRIPAAGLELATIALLARRSNQLS